MANIIYEDKFYNEETKKLYIEKFGAGTKKILTRLFKITQPSETEKGKDLYNFTREELRKVFFLFMASTASSSRGNVTYVSGYIDWTIDEGYLKGLNPLDSTSREWKEQFVVRAEKRFWTDKELREIEDKLVNEQDSVILTLLRYGVRGTENSEITGLRRKDIDSDNNTLHLNDSDGTSRSIKVDDYVIAQCERALSQDVYAKKNGNPSEEIKSETASLVENDYVVRSANTRTIHFDDADKNVVYRRLTTISNEFDEPNLTPTSVQNSGMLALAKKLLDQSGKLGDEEFTQIQKQFNVSGPSLARIKMEFLNVEEINKLYK